MVNEKEREKQKADKVFSRCFLHYSRQYRLLKVPHRKQQRQQQQQQEQLTTTTATTATTTRTTHYNNLELT